jgi:hypothetical protein
MKSSTALPSQPSEYRIPKREISAEASFLGHPDRVLRLFLNERAARHDGEERLSDLLNGPGEFLPALEPPGKVVLLRKDALTVLTVSAEVEFPGERDTEGVAPAGVSRVRAEIVLQDGTEIRGEVVFAMPEGRTRLVDFLNLPERFFAVLDAHVARLVNKHCIARVSILSPEPGT